MTMRRFEIEFSLQDGFYVMDSGIIEIDQAVIDNVDDEWRASLYDLHTPEEIAAQVGFCRFVLGLPLTSMDGWANLNNNMLKVIEYPTLDNFDVKAKEVTK